MDLPTRLPLLLTIAGVMLASAAPAAEDKAGVAFFETKIRPVLVAHCYKCHSAEAKSPKAGLRLDSRDGLRKGGDSGPAVVPGKPAESLLLKAMRHSDEALRMPAKKLPDAVLADFESWIARGAPDPRTETALRIDGRKHWAFQPVTSPAVPEVRDRAWATNAIDRFVLARLEARGLTPSPAADRRTLLRRVYFDLIGLPPAAEQLDAFAAEPHPDAYARAVEELLASPAYGERWGRHWLDVARYADTKDGVLMYGDERVRPFAYTYRDYVIRALNEDTPYVRFVHEQLAADQVAPKEEPWRLGAMGFLTLGRVFDENIHDILDDRIDTVTRGLLGLTVSCARCHDHKYDPIPAADYYALYGVFASSEAPVELPLVSPGEVAGAAAEFETKANAARLEVRKLLDTQYAQLLETARQRVGDYLVHVVTTKPDPLETAIFFLSLDPNDLRPQVINRWRLLVQRRARGDDPVFGPWHDLMRVPEARIAEEATRLPWAKVNPLVVEALRKAKLATHADVARAYGDLLRRVYDESKKATTPPDEATRELLALMTSTDSPCYFPRTQTRDYMSRKEKDAFASKLGALDVMAVKAAHAPARAMVLHDAAEVYEPRVFVRGDPARPGDRVPRRFLRVLGGERMAFANGSGRLDLARAITSPDNPLTARVLVNRVWMHHFREPLVDSPSDFGLRTAPPSHPDLLDHLATRLVEDGWSLKRLHRLIVLSSTYRQASLDRPDCRAIDADNRLLWRMNRRRLDLEAMRDTMLFLSGRLDRRMYGRPVDVAGDPANARRTVYGLVDRQSVPGVFRAFDFASPDQSAERRPQTTVPQQALFGMNAPFVLHQARAVAARLDGDTDRRVEQLVRLVLGRGPTADEAKRFREYVETAGTSPSRLTPWQQLAQVLLVTNELVFVD